MSFFADLLGNAALSGERVVGNINQQQDTLERERVRNDLEIARSETIAKQRMAMEDQQRQGSQRRSADQMAQTELAADEAGQKRAVAGANKLYGRSDLAYGDLSPEEVAMHNPDNVVQRLGDQLTAARKGGLHDAESELKSAYSETVKALQQQHKEQFEQSKLAQGERKLDNQFELGSRMAGAAETRASAAEARANAADRRAASGGDPYEKLTTQKQAVLRELALYKEPGFPLDEKDPQVAGAMAELASINAALKDKRGGNTATGKTAPPPAAKTSSTTKSGGATPELTYDPKTRTFK